jgi:hypothetical protein
MQEFQFIALVPDKDCVFVTYVGRDIDGHRFQNIEVVTVRAQQVVNVEVYFGWSIPHQAPEGDFIEASGSKRY